MKDSEEVSELQDAVSQLLARHRSVLDCLTKHHESTSRINRAFSKAVTSCGCISINANRQNFPGPSSGTLEDCPKHAHSHLQGRLCASCFEFVEEEIGNHLFYLTAICDLLDINLNEVIKNEFSRINTLGPYVFT